MKYLKNSSTLQYRHELCRGCGRCVEVCPRGVFVMGDSRAAVTDRDRCMECGACMKNCDYGAIAVHAGVGCAAALINAMKTGGKPVCDCGSGQGTGCC